MQSKIKSCHLEDDFASCKEAYDSIHVVLSQKPAF